MALREFSTIGYLPLLSVRPAEMRGLQELPSQDKDLLFPLIALRPWTTAHHLDSALARIEEAYGERPIGIVLDDELAGAGPRRPVHDELDELRIPANGYANWVEFIESRPNFVPAVMLDDPAQLNAQLERISLLDRGVIIRVPSVAFAQASALVQIASGHFDAEDVCVVLDFERQSSELLARAAVTSNVIQGLRNAAPGIYIATSASSFPDAFVGLEEQDIYERQFFTNVVGAIGADNLIYSDRGSARAERQQGGGGQPAPRVDNALQGQWRFFREEDTGDRLAAYQEAASRAMDDDDWDPSLHMWGTQMIERTSDGDPDAIISPLRSTAVRINLHLHQQTFFGDGDALLDTDEEWSD